jgi:U32 family peptidase
MPDRNCTIELLAPAGNIEKLETAIHYGADAVYLSGQNFSLRNFAGNFSLEELHRAVRYAHMKYVKVYLACNIYPRNSDEAPISEYLHQIGDIRPDAIIIADPGILMEARRIIPHIPVHLSTQANTTSRLCARFWESLGVTRINIARELSLREIKEIADATSIEIEAFVHGAMCISHSGRCLLSSFMADRDGNRGMCTHPCRWNYFLVEETRPGQYMPVLEDDRGTYIFNSKDLCMIDHVSEMIEAGITSFKIEGRLKGINYLATVVKTYREAIDAYELSPGTYKTKPHWQKELAAINQREYCTGFYLNEEKQTVPNYTNETPLQQKQFAGKILDVIDQKWIKLDVRNKLQKGDMIEILPAKGPAQAVCITEIINDRGGTSSCAQPEDRAIIGLAQGIEASPNDIVRKDLTFPE